MSENGQEKIIQAYQIAAKGNFDHARMVLDEVLYDHPDQVEGWLLMADLADEPEEARQCYQRVLEKDPANWVAQQRMKLLFASQNGSFAAPLMGAPAYELAREAEVPMDDLPETFEEDFGDYVDLNLDVPLEKEPPTLEESMTAHRKLILRVLMGLGLLLVLGVLTWVATVGFMVWKTGFLAWFGF